MSDGSLLYRDRIDINEYISVMIPKVGEVIDCENEYYNLVTMITAMPIDFMVQLDDLGIDFTEINEFDLFIVLFNTLKCSDTTLLFGNLDLTKFELGTNEQNNNLVLYSKESGTIIDRAVHGRIANALRRIHHLEKNIRKPANKEAKEYMLERARIKQKRHKNKKFISQLEPLIMAMVCCEQYKYNLSGTRDLTIYQFNEMVIQVKYKNDYNNVMSGIYAGNVDPKKVDKEILNWIYHK